MCKEHPGIATTLSISTSTLSCPPPNFFVFFLFVFNCISNFFVSICIFDALFALCTFPFCSLDNSLIFHFVRRNPTAFQASLGENYAESELFKKFFQFHLGLSSKRLLLWPLLAFLFQIPYFFIFPPSRTGQILLFHLFSF